MRLISSRATIDRRTPERRRRTLRATDQRPTVIRRAGGNGRDACLDSTPILESPTRLIALDGSLLNFETGALPGHCVSKIDGPQDGRQHANIGFGAGDDHPVNSLFLQEFLQEMP